MRRLGYRVVDRIVDHLTELGELPPIRVGDAGELRAALGGPPPEAGRDPDAALDALFEQVLPYIQAGDHPRFFARIGSPSNYMSVLADAVASGFNVFTGSGARGPGAGAGGAGGVRRASTCSPARGPAARGRQPWSWSCSTGFAWCAGCPRARRACWSLADRWRAWSRSRPRVPRGSRSGRRPTRSPTCPRRGTRRSR